MNGAELQMLGIAAGLSKDGLTRMAGLSPNTVRRAEKRGHVLDPRSERAIRRALGLEAPAETESRDGSRFIELTDGTLTVLDPEDFSRAEHLKWRRHPCGYAMSDVRQPDGSYSSVLLHRFILGAPKGFDVHHRDGDKLNNRRSNLEIKSPGEHRSFHAHAGGPHSGRFKGVSFQKQQRKWQAVIRMGGRCRYLGLFPTAEEAARVYNHAAVEAWGTGCYLNPVPPRQLALPGLDC
jgi:hypothetical protein